MINISTPLKYSVGIDCSKDEFHGALILLDSTMKMVIKSTRKFSNTPRGFSSCASWIKSHQKLAIPVGLTMEATGNYHENLAFYFYNNGFHVNVVLPNKAKKYLQSLGFKSKNDTIDSKGLALMGAQQQLECWEPLSSSIYELRTLTRYHEQLTCHRTQLKNQLSSLKYNIYQVKVVINGLKKQIALLDKQLLEIKERIEQMINQDAIISERINKILPVKGVGVLTLATIIAETNGFKLFKNQRQLTSYAGYDVVENQSGKRTGKTRISKKGNRHIRRIMHMAAFNVVKYGEPKFVNLYNRIMSRNTLKMIAYVAIQRKLLCLIYALWKKNEAYDTRYGTSGNAEQKILFPHGFEETRKVGGPINPPTQDELPYKAFAGSSLSAV